MKKTVVVLLCLAFVATAAFGQQVLSKNAVGYVRKSLDKGKYYLMNVNFNMLTGANTVSNVFPASSSGLPSGTKIYIWNDVGQSYAASETLETFPSTRWNPGTNVLELGRSFWVRIPPSAVSNTYELFTMGEVPDETNVVKNLRPGFTFASFPYPVETKITNSMLGSVVKSGDKVYFFDPNGGWASETWQTFPTVGWNPGTNIFRPGDAILIKSTLITNWNQAKPYTWP